MDTSLQLVLVKVVQLQLSIRLVIPLDNDFYNGMRITVTTGTGSGQTAYIGAYTSATKTATVFKEDGTAGFDVFGSTSVLQLLLTQQQITKLNQE